LIGLKLTSRSIYTPHVVHNHVSTFCPSPYVIQTYPNTSTNSNI